VKTQEQEATRNRRAARDAIIRRLAAQVRADVADSGKLVDDDILWVCGAQALWAIKRVGEKIDAEIVRQWLNPESDPPRIKLTPYERRLIVQHERSLAVDEGRAG
jgi:ketosteroid isomerase-like protein